MSDDEWARIEAVAAHYALNAASLIRMLVKREADSLGAKVVGDAPAKRGGERRATRRRST